MAVAGLPHDWEASSHSARVRRAIELGRLSRSDPRASGLLREWRSGGFTQRLLAAYACHGSRDSAALLTSVADPSRTIAGVALAVLAHVGDDGSLTSALGSLAPRRAARALLKLRRRRPGVVDRCIDALADEGRPAAWPMVPLGSAASLDRHFEVAADRGGVVFWRRLASLHPARAAAEIAARLDAAATPDGLLFAHARAVVGVLSRRDPDAALGLASALRRRVPLATIPLASLAGRRAARVADLILAPGEPAAGLLRPQARRLDAGRIIALCRRDAYTLGPAGSWLPALPAADREAIYREIGPAWADADGIVPASIVRTLPASLRQAEARRIAAIPALATRPLQRLPFVGLLPWDEAKAEAGRWLSLPEAETRAAALVASCEAAGFDGSRLADLLALLAARKHEQDPVRRAFLDALAALPPGRWRPEHLPGLTRVVRDALDAGDLSTAGVSAIGRLESRLLPFHRDWAVARLAELTRERGETAWVARDLSADDLRAIAPALNPVVRAWLDREDEWRVVALASAVGRRLPGWPELVDALERIVRSGRDQAAAPAMALIAERARADRGRVIVSAVATDPSWVLQRPVMNFLNLHRQELLTPFLGQRAYAGRFSTGMVRHVLPLESGFFRWTDAQQEIFAGSLGELAEPPAREDGGQVAWDVLFAVRRLPSLPAVGPGRLARLARDDRPAVREAAVRALGRLDARQGIPELLGALGDERARWAVYALRQALNDLSPTRVLEVLRDAPLDRVTVAKEAIRLAGEFGGDAALAWFGDLHRRDLHRDVRAALLRAMWDHLDRPEAWAILDPAAASPDLGVAIGLARIQAGRASEAARDRVAGLLRRLLDHPEPIVRLAVLRRLASQPGPDPRRALLGATLAKLSSAMPDERAAALAAALAGAADADAPAFGSAFAGLLPDRRALAASVAGFVDAIRPLGRRLPAVLSAVMAAVAGDPGLSSLQLRLAEVRFAAEPYAKWVLDLGVSGRWNAATQLAALEALTQDPRPAEELEQAEAVWAASPDPAARWLALRLLGVTALMQGWTDSRRRRLQAYREDPSPLVADEAALTFPPEPSSPGRPTP